MNQQEFCFSRADEPRASEASPLVRPVNRLRSDTERRGRQGKCVTCKECYRWHSRRPLRLAYCPACGDKLRGTTHLNAWPWNIGVEPLTAIQAWQKFHKA